MGYATANQVLTQAASELALPQVSDFVAASDALSVQLEALLVKLCRDLAEEDWKQFQTEFTTTTDGVTNPIALNADFRALVPQTTWNRSQRLPMVGPLTPEQWQRYTATTMIVVTGTPFRIWKNALYLYPLTGFATGQLLALEYYSAYWAQPMGKATPTADTIAASTDVLWFDKSLLVAGVKLYWKKEKGFDTSAAQPDFDARYQAARDDDSAAPLLNATGRAGGIHLIGPENLPDGNW